jgi:Protein of unknown function (DUF541)
MRILFAASTAAAAGLIAAGVLGVADAETPAGTSPVAPRSVSVQGVAIEPIEQSANAANATTVYRQGMTDAIADGLAKAQFLSSKAGATLGAVQSIAEGGGYIECGGETEYLGAQPDFGSSGVAGTLAAPAESAAGVSAPRPGNLSKKTPAKHTKKHSHHVKAKKAATTGSCTLSTQVSVVYALN